jgi:C4-dicarboxylate-specific signal transduction histidine kinase
VQQREPGQPIAILETNNDVTDRRRAEDALRRSEAYLVEAQRLSCTGSFGWSPATGEIVWSAETFRIFQYDPANKPTLDVVRERTHPADRRAVECLLERASNNFVNWEIEHRLLLPDASLRYVRVVAHAERDTKGNLEYVGAIMDVTAARRAEDDLRQAQSNLAHVNRVSTLGEMSASIAHEVSQPLAAIVTNAGAGLRWLAADHSDLEEVKLALSRIYKDGNRANDVISQIRALAKKLPTRKDRFNLNEVVLEVVALVRGEAERSRTLVTTDFSRDQAFVTGDRVQLQQVVLNLIINAIEAMSGGDKGRRRDLLVATGMQSAIDVFVAVRDTGPGLDPEQRDRVFDAFYTTKSHGLGMGLAICRSIIEAHDGRLWVTPNEPHGAVFQFTLPRVE